MNFINILCVIGLLLGLLAVWLAIRPKKYTTLFMLFSMVLLPCGNIIGQSNCNSVVADTAGMLSGRAIQVEQAASALINQGADVHVVTVPDSKGNLDLIENDIEKSCPSWRNGQGVRKSTLLALLVSRDRKLGVYYGSAWHSALDSHWNRIKTDYMVPRFRDGDYAGGFIAAEEQFARRLAAAKDESLKPAITQNQVINQPTDFSGLWKFFLWLLTACFILMIGYLFYRLFTRSRREKQATKSAQQKAQVAFNQAASDIKLLEELIETKEAVGENVSQRCKDYLDVANQQFTNLANSISTSPQTDDLTESDYDVMEQQYEKVSKAVMVAKSNIDYVAVKANKEKEPSKKSETSKTSSSGLSSNPSHYSKPSEGGVLVAPAQPYNPPAPVYTPPPVYVDPAPSVVIINNDSYRHHDDDSTHFERDSEKHEPSSSGSGFGWSSSSSSSSSDSGGGGSSSWSSSDSSSSSSYDSGSSSSWDSGSSDSGGGGSSDF